MNLSELGIGDTATVLSLRLARPARLRLMEMGLLPGVEVTLEQRTPWGDPLVIFFRGYRLVITRADAASIRIRARSPQAPERP